jgi:hypothetical protein
MGVDLGKTIAEAFAVFEDCDKLIRLATDPAAKEGERSNAALAACRRIRQAHVLEQLRVAKAWIESHRTAFERALHAAAFLDSFRR